MDENDSPNAKPVVRKLRQTTLVFTRNKGIAINSKTKPQLKNRRKNKMNSNKRLKKEDSDIDEVLRSEPTVEPIPEPIPDPRLEEPDEDELNTECSVIYEKPENPNQLPLDINLSLMEDCAENNPIVIALKTIEELKEEFTSMGLELDEHLYEESATDTTTGAVCEVESIFNSQLRKDRLTYYWVKWKNWSQEYNTWEPLSNLLNCRQLVDEFRFIKNMCNQRMDSYNNYYTLKGIIEDIVERKTSWDVMVSVLLVFNGISLKEYNYTKAMVNKMRGQLRDRHLAAMDKISETKNVEKRVGKLCSQYERLLQELCISKRFQDFEKFSEYFIKRKELDLRLKVWENEINDIISNQNEGQTIIVENYVDCEVPPPNFEYISNCKTLDSKITISDDPPVYCECDDCETQFSKCCVASNQSTIQYTKNGILKDSKNNRNAIYECNKRCKCEHNCINRVVQNGRKHRLAIFRTDDGKGWGVRALEPIHKGSYVMEYVGEIISVDEANRRGQIYDAEGRTYLFDLDYTPDESAKYSLDATQCGNVSHFVNHSCDPNLDTRVVWINNLDPFMPHIALFAVRSIKLNEELTFDYKINVHGITDADESQETTQLNQDSTLNSDKSYDSGIDGSGTEAKPMRVLCQCGTQNCRKYLF